ncbi:MAG: PEP-CTERM sorting domain-containing protein [Armatimonadota bacterium]|nr:PEP-CTERM sorting domain-containing protein [Armatimonadota bacterium]
MRKLLLGIVLSLGLVAWANAQVNDVVILDRLFNDDSDSISSHIKALPAVLLTDNKVDGDGSAPEFANRHAWFASYDGVNVAKLPLGTAGWTASFDLTLIGSPVAPRKEAGFLLRIEMPWGYSEGQFIVNTDAGEVVAFGWPFPFYSFNAQHGLSYTSGQTLHMGVKLYRDPTDNMVKVVYHAGGYSSPALALDFQDGLGNWISLGGYLQVQIAPNNPGNAGAALFNNIYVVPEPASVAVLGLGVAALVLRRRKR